MSTETGDIKYHVESIYAGYTYRRIMCNLIYPSVFNDHNLESITTDFLPRYLNDIPYNGMKVPVFPDPWTAHRSICWDAARVATMDVDEDHKKFELIQATRIYMPVHVFEYDVFGETFRAFIPGTTVDSVPLTTDDIVGFAHTSGMENWSLSETIAKFCDTVGTPKTHTDEAIQSVLRNVFKLSGPIGLFEIFKLPFTMFRLLNPTARAALMFLGAGRLLWTWLVRPSFQNRKTTDEWTKQKEREREEMRRMKLRDVESEWARNDFTTSERERSYERKRREKEGAEKRRRMEQEQQQKQYQQQSRQQQYQQQGPNKYESGGVKFDFDVTDNYAILKIPRTATKADITKAFRTEMLRWHPDHQRDKSDKDQKYASERSKLITRAFQELKTRR
jgi:hypothetical protein